MLHFRDGESSSLEGHDPMWHRGGGGGRGKEEEEEEGERFMEQEGRGCPCGGAADALAGEGRKEGRTPLVQSFHASSSGSSGHNSSLSRVMQPPPAPDPRINTVTS